MTFSLWSFFKAPAPEAIRCGSSELALFTRQLAIMVRSGVPLVTSLEVLSRGEDTLALRVAPMLARRVSQGSRLSVAFRAFPRIFPSAYVWLINGAEETGTLHKTLDLLADWLERQDKLVRQVRKALTYPVTVLLITAILTVALFRTVIPGILDAVVGMGAQLPAPTRALLMLANACKSPWTWFLLVILVVAVVGYLRSPQGRRSVIDLFLAMPVLGDLLCFAASARMSLTLSMLLESGIEVSKACVISGAASGLPQMEEDANRIRAELREGLGLSQIYGSSALYPRLLSDMLRAGEESGRLTGLIHHASMIFEEETYSRLESFTNLLEPIVLAGISLAVGFIVIAVMMPMSSMLGAL